MSHFWECMRLCGSNKHTHIQTQSRCTQTHKYTSVARILGAYKEEVPEGLLEVCEHSEWFLEICEHIEKTTSIARILEARRVRVPVWLIQLLEICEHNEQNF